MRCALIEFNYYHDEVLPTFVWLLNRLGVTPDVYMVQRSARRRPFAGTSGLRFRRRSVEGIDRLRGLVFRLRRYDLLIVNSMEPATVLDRVGLMDIPTLGVVHNTELLASEGAYRTFFESPGRRPLVLGEHIAAAFRDSLGRVPWISHVVFGATSPVARDDARPTTFVVSGNVEAHRRNYELLLDAVSALDAEGLPFLIRIVGRSWTPDGKALRATIEARGLSNRFEYSPGEIDHPRFYELVASSDFSLPLIDTGREAFRAYLVTKLASSVPFAIGLSVPLVAHVDLARAYGVEGTGPTYEEGNLADAMRAAIASTPGQRADWRAALATKREAILEASLANLREAIASVGVQSD